MEAIQETPDAEESMANLSASRQPSNGSETRMKSNVTLKLEIRPSSISYSPECTENARGLTGHQSKPTSSSSAAARRLRNSTTKTKLKLNDTNERPAEEYYSVVNKCIKIEGQKPPDDDTTPTVTEKRHLSAGSLALSGRESQDRGMRSTEKRLLRKSVPPVKVRLTSVSMFPSDRNVQRESSFYVEEPRSNSKVIRWDVANNARPPLQIDMEGPTPWTYTPRNKPLNETNSPSWSFGSKCFIEKAGGSRTSWEKTWFQNNDIWRNKVDFLSDGVWPTPSQYEKKQLLGPNQSTAMEAPSFSIGQRRSLELNKPGSDKEPAPNNYSRISADSVTLKKDPAFSLQFRRGGTCLWSYRENTPGPAAYSPRFTKSKPLGPSFKIVGIRREKSHVLGPFATF